MDELHRPLHYYLRDIAEISPSQFLEHYDHPALLSWKEPGQDEDTELQFGTLIVGQIEDQPEASFNGTASQLAGISVIEVRKRAGSTPSKMILVGRSPENDIVLVDKTISKLHAYFQKAADGETYELVDAGSTNLTRVNGQFLTPHKAHLLSNLDRIDFGPSNQLMYLTAAGFHDFLANLNRRKAQRADIRWPVTLNLPKGPKKSETGNLSTLGVHIPGIQTQKVGEVFTLAIEAPNRSAIEATVEVAWKAETSHLGMGVRFIEISDNDLQFISRKVLDHLK
jgi:pSer/pThr/pTyr-binding forkhead associated (FHA) protein